MIGKPQLPSLMSNGTGFWWWLTAAFTALGVIVGLIIGYNWGGYHERSAQSNPPTTTNADSDEAGHAFQIEAGHPFRFEAGHCSDLKSATWRHSAGREDVVLVFRRGSSAGSAERKEEVPLARREAVPVVNRRDPRATRRALAADAASRAGGPC